MSIAPSNVVPAKPATFRAVFRQWAGSVAVVTTLGPHGPTGMTATAVCPLSLDPMLVLVCFRNESHTLTQILARQRFAINLLHAHQAQVSVRFANSPPETEPFSGVAYHVVDGAPVLDDALARVLCHLEAVHPGGDHTIVVGAVTGLDHVDGEPLVYHDGTYRSLRPLPAP